MNIVHVTPYLAENMTYQENLLPEGQALLGHNVTIITGVNEPDFGFNRDSRRQKVGSINYGSCKLSRLDHYVEFTNRSPVLKSLYAEIDKCSPDILFIHDVGAALVVAILYKKRNPNVLLHFDCHSDFKNSRTSMLGPIYHSLFRFLFLNFGGLFDKIFAVAPETIEFLKNVYGLSKDQITLLPLPGDASLLQDAHSIRTRLRAEWGLSDRHRILIHTGKMPSDKLTLKVLNMFQQLNGDEYRLFVVGAIDPSFQNTFDDFIYRDERISFHGWTSGYRLREFFIASDLLLAPGSLSNTFIDAVCCALPVLLDDTPQGRFVTQWGNGVVHPRGSHLDLLSLVQKCITTESIDKFRHRALFAAEYLDYRNIAKLSLT
jgi:glycosyltransferase involved in cell wall biosynthesis